MNKFMHKFSWISILGAGVFMLYYAFCMLYPYNPIEIEQPVKILTPIVKSGGEVIYEVTYCKYTTKSGLISRNLVDGVRFNLGAIQSNVPCGCHTSRTTVQLPKSIELDGKFHLESIVEYQMNPFRTISIETETEEFEIVP